MMIAACALSVSAAFPAAAQDKPQVCYLNINGRLVPTYCPDTSETKGTTASADQGADADADADACSTTVVSNAAALLYGLPAPPSGKAWAILDCGGISVTAAARFVLVNSARPQVKPQELALEAYGELVVPILVPGTAPPRGKDGLVGLPEWFWVPAASWHPVQKTVRAGPVWATVTATPTGLTFDPGGGLSPVSCEGPGAAYDKDESPDVQSTDCDYTYLQSSANQPGGVYQATLNVTWRVSWIGSGGGAGVLRNALAVASPFAIDVTQAEALVTGS